MQLLPHCLGFDNCTHRWCTNKQVLVSLHGRLKQLALDTVQSFKPFKASLCILGQLLDCHKNLMTG